ncbi:hypothetical protein BLOT_013632 [Blomia tropicalis]|nr:hypothetical protein BLOT_013632 [Blomia tropicalis]
MIGGPSPYNDFDDDDDYYWIQINASQRVGVVVVVVANNQATMSMLPLFAMANIISQWITDQFMPSPTGFNGINHYKAEHERLKRGLSPLSNNFLELKP